MFTRRWQQLSDFLEQARLIPLVIVVSVYHYYQALATHDPFYVAAPIALFVDLLHFRTVQRAVRFGGMWRMAGLLTTIMAFGLQWTFYRDGGDLVLWQSLLFAAIVPVGVALMAWHHEEGEVAVVPLSRLKRVIRFALRYRQNFVNECQRHANTMAERDDLVTRVDKLFQERDEAMAERDTLARQCAKNTVDVDQLPPRLAAYVRSVANGVTPNGEFSSEFGVGVSSLERANSMLLKRD